MTDCGCHPAAQFPSVIVNLLKRLRTSGGHFRWGVADVTFFSPSGRAIESMQFTCPTCMAMCKKVTEEVFGVTLN